MTAFALTRRTAISLTALALLMTERTFAATAESAGERFGVIEIGSSGVKPSIIRIVGADEPDIETIESLPTEETNAFDPQNATRVAQQVKKNMADMAAKGIAANRLIVVGSSGVADSADARTAVRDAVKQETGLDLAFVSVDKEVEYTFDGVVNLKRLKHRRTQVALVDIGSGNTKGGFLVASPTGGEQFQIFSMPLATKTFAKLVQKEMKDEEFAIVARRLAESNVRPMVRAMIAQAGPILAQRNRVYLNGGLAWAVASTQNPLNTDRYVPLSKAAIDRFCKLAVTDQKALFEVDTTGITNPTHKKLISGDLTRLSSGKVFQPDEYVAGAELLRVIAEEMHLADKILFFPRPGRIAWVIGYAFELAREGKIAKQILPI